MLFTNIKILDENFQVRDNCYVAVEGDKISYIGEEMPQEYTGRVYDGTGKLLMSGFYNAHAHSPMALMRGYGENLPLQRWLNERIFPFEDKLDGEAVYNGTMLCMAESFRYGIVSTSDMYYFCEEMAQAVIESGAKANISRSIVNFGGADPKGLVSMREAEDLYRKCHNAGSGRVKIDASLHAEYTSDFATAQAVADFAKAHCIISHIHVSETKLEHEECIARHGLTPAAYLEKAGLFDTPAIAAHCVYSTDEDLEIFKEKCVTIAHNPVSNMKLASGICDVNNAIAKGVNVAIGTDSVASNNSLAFIEEMKLMAIGCKAATGNAEAVTPVDALRAATIGGALAQGRKDCGALKVGNKADLIAIDVSGPNMHPVHQMVNNLVYSASSSDVKLTMIDGRVVYDDGEYPTLDIEKVIYNAENSTKNILKRL
ncbi:MAG: amidohydrolase [Eubacterium sp.]|nr:amidohydrolase [Candidatus Colimonas fimequi]